MTYNHNCQSMEIILGIFFLDYVWQNPLISGLWQNPWILHFIASMGFAMELWEMPLHGKTHTPWLLPLCMTFAMHNGFSHRIPYYTLDSRCMRMPLSTITIHWRQGGSGGCIKCIGPNRAWFCSKSGWVAFMGGGAIANAIFFCLTRLHCPI